MPGAPSQLGITMAIADGAELTGEAAMVVCVSYATVSFHRGVEWSRSPSIENVMGRPTTSPRMTVS